MYGRMNMHWTRYEVFAACGVERMYACTLASAPCVDVFAHAHFAGTHERRYALRGARYICVYVLCMCNIAGDRCARTCLSVQEARYALRRDYYFDFSLQHNNFDILYKKCLWKEDILRGKISKCAVVIYHSAFSAR